MSVQATLKKKSGEVLATLTLPRTAADVSLVRYVSFLSEMKKFELEGANPMHIMAAAVGEFTGIDLATILQAKVGEQWEQDKELDGGIRSLYGWCVNALSSFKGEARKPDGFTFGYQGDTYRIPFIVAAEIAGGLPILPELETGEAIEAFETIRGFQQQIKDAGDPKGERKRRIFELEKSIAKGIDTSGDMAREVRKLNAEIEYDGDPNGNLMFAQYLRMIAILAKMDGEQLPANDGDRERWIQARMIRFQGIDCKTALDVDFFLIGLLMHSKKTHPAIGSLILPLFALAAATQSRPRPKERRTIERYRTKRKFKNGSAGGR